MILHGHAVVAPFEKEGLAIIFGVKKFHQYLHGRQFEIKTDHGTTTQYSIEGKNNMANADALSRLPP